MSDVSRCSLSTQAAVSLRDERRSQTLTRSEPPKKRARTEVRLRARRREDGRRRRRSITKEEDEGEDRVERGWKEGGWEGGRDIGKHLSDVGRVAEGDSVEVEEGLSDVGRRESG